MKVIPITVYLVSDWARPGQWGAKMEPEATNTHYAPELGQAVAAAVTAKFIRDAMAAIGKELP